ncbi:GNAT family N-acetyltransferase [Chamaesiphon minutus]|uniref:Acetyltransferase, ribosomal protein N-acetylase n=1 Tax=Chamaesiphon minutus (strain ATCC 27169 / PCC 6605) TaxID=1173020 RepID=K9UL87_CHAP6|nr:GNAT family N-acetyltransferase [Chamaesiphon minutus]AFY95847.1 acetyltransferase, ribosomal protein N-acetylase [Chamaesiphon minutus PCC 6605]
MSFELETQRLRLQPILASDSIALHNIFIDPYVRKYLCDDRVWELQQVEEMSLESQNLFDTQKLGLWFIKTRDPEEIVGFVGLWYFFEEDQPQLVYALIPTAINKGYATEAALKIIEYSFNKLGYQYLLASCDRPNLESIKLARRLGMREVEQRTSEDKPIVFFRIEKELVNTI